MWSLLIPEADGHTQGHPGVAPKMFWGCGFPQTVVLVRVFGGRASSPPNQHYSSASTHKGERVWPIFKMSCFWATESVPDQKWTQLSRWVWPGDIFRQSTWGSASPRPIIKHLTDRVWIGAVKLLILFTTKMLILLKPNGTREHSEFMEDLSH